MTKKQYKRRVMETFRKCVKKNGTKCHCTDRINTPNWGHLIVWGPHKGEVLRSYEQAWDTIKAVANE